MSSLTFNNYMTETLDFEFSLLHYQPTNQPSNGILMNEPESWTLTETIRRRLEKLSISRCGTADATYVRNFVG